MRCASVFSGFKFRKSSTQRTQRITENHREIGPSFSGVDYSPPPGSPPCSLWLFSVFSVLNSEKRNTEDTKFHREPQRNRPSFFRRLQPLGSREDFFPRGEFFDAISARSVADSGAGRDEDCALRRDFDFGIDHVFGPVTAAGGDISRKREIG